MRFGERPGKAIILCLGIAGASQAQDDWMNTRDSFICRSSTEVREIKTYVAEDRPSCRVDYIKSGTTKIIWSSTSSRSYCNGKAGTLAARLAAGHFSCAPLHAPGTGKD